MCSPALRGASAKPVELSRLTSAAAAPATPERHRVQETSATAADRAERWRQAPAEWDVGLRNSHCPNFRREGRTTTRP
ncbi:hypothetical protein GCM10027074_25180 [Streptomyces deserti]